MCAERTDEHCEAFKEGVEAVFWSDAKECVEKCRRLLADNELIAAMKRNGHQRYLQSPYNNEAILTAILNHDTVLGGAGRGHAGVSSAND